MVINLLLAYFFKVLCYCISLCDHQSCGSSWLGHCKGKEIFLFSASSFHNPHEANGVGWKPILYYKLWSSHHTSATTVTSSSSVAQTLGHVSPYSPKSSNMITAHSHSLFYTNKVFFLLLFYYKWAIDYSCVNAKRHFRFQSATETLLVNCT